MAAVVRVPLIVALLLACAVLAGCGIQGQDCPTALLEGELTRGPDADLVVTHSDDAKDVRVVWEPEHDVREVDGALVLVDRTGSIVAREGDRVSMGGGFGQGDVFRPCGDIVVSPAR